MRRVMFTALCVGLWWGVIGQAHAFRLPANFNQSAAIGGSGGRYFTGSPRDRYTCKVCHTGAATPQLLVSGLPPEGYVPGQTYSIVIDWDDRLPSVAFNLEMTDATGRAFGTFSMPAATEAAPGELCAGRPAVVVAPGAERTLALLTECGAQQATIRWTAPAASADATGQLTAPDAWFSGSVLSSDKDGSILGDGVMDLSRVVAAAGGTSPVVTRIHGDCTVVHLAAEQNGWFAGVWMFVAALWRLRRGRRRDS